MGRYAARGGELRFGLLGDGLFGRLLLLVVRLDGGNPLLLLDPVDVGLARQRPIVAAPTLDFGDNVSWCCGGTPRR